MTYNFLLPNLSAGGAERISLIFARFLKRSGLEVRFINLGHEGGELSEWLIPEFEVVSLNRSRSLKAIPALVKFLRKHKGDIVFASRENASIAGIIACRLARRPIIIRLPNMPSNRLHQGAKGLKLKIVKWVNKRLYRQAQTVIAQTEDMRDEAIAYYGLAPEKVVAIYNPVDTENILANASKGGNPFTKGGKHFLSVGTIEYRKGIDTLLDAFSSFRSQNPDSTLTILGRKDGEYARKLVEKWDGKNGVEFCGFRENPYVYMAHCDVFVLPSRMEGFPNVLLEAMSLNKAVVATTCLPVISQLVHDGTNGFVCPVDDAETMANCMTKALELKDIHNTYTLFDKQKLLQVFHK